MFLGLSGIHGHSSQSVLSCVLSEDIDLDLHKISFGLTKLFWLLKLILFLEIN